VNRIPSAQNAEFARLEAISEMVKPFLAEVLPIVGDEKLYVKAPIASSRLARLQGSGRFSDLLQGFSPIPGLAFKLHVTFWLLLPENGPFSSHDPR